MSNSWKIYVLAIVSFLVGTSENIIAGILDMVAEDMGVSLAAAGQLITVFSLAYAFGTPILMAVTARVERRKLMLAALSVFFVGNIVAVTATGYISLMGSRIILALSTGVFVVVALTVAAKLAQPGKQGAAIATLVMGFSTSLIIGVPLGRVIASAYDWKLIFVGIGVLGLLGMLIILRTIPKSEGEAPVPVREQFKLLRNPRIALALSVTFFWIFGYSIVYTYISPYLLTITHMSERAVSIGLFAFGVASLIGSKLGGYGTDKWGIPRTLIGGLLLHCGVLFLLTAFSQSAVLVFPLLMLWAFSAWSSGPTQQYYLMTLSPEASGIMLSLNSSVLQLAMAAGAGIGGIIVESVSLSAISWIGAIGIAIAATLTAMSFGLLRNKSRVAGHELGRVDVKPEASSS
ncbi:MFS transporter [Cohnella abietis]|uniref:Putative MFS-type transporter YbcL n=1 Tax=Cohnella abietis TaxID=2507935 RepID=A0A3T1D8X8_9BACL|nr:MFS transporter [Cohnella abietis]BBI34536.1 putative MFS-type transporter YbcL [Cohnella abietis]